MQDLRETEVDELDEPLAIYHHVFRFYVSVDDVVPLQGLQSAEQLTGVELDPLGLVFLP